MCVQKDMGNATALAMNAVRVMAVSFILASSLGIEEIWAVVERYCYSKVRRQRY